VVEGYNYYLFNIAYYCICNSIRGVDHSGFSIATMMALLEKRIVVE
jgi:hypothetical protein